jgi:hypothetical protein
MSVVVEMQNTGDASLRTEVIAAVEHLFADRAGEWRVSIIGSQASDRWQMKVTGPHGFERSYTLEGLRASTRRRSFVGSLRELPK